jgi:hypothetical protein
MPLIERETVLILGAGASYPYGYPLGAELVDFTISVCASQGEERGWLQAVGCTPKSINELRISLEAADPYSVDAFLEQHNAEVQNVGKAAIALALLQREIDSGAVRLNPRRFFRERRTNDIDKERAAEHWYQYLAHFLTSGVTSAEFKNHRLSIVTFNYDRSLEEYLPSAWRTLRQR